MNDKLKYCLCTEATDITFPYFRVMLTSFLKHNSGWFSGKLVILTCDINPLSKANRQIIKEIYSDVEYINIDSRKYELIHCSKQEKIHLYKTEVFNLNSYDIILYISHLSLCLSNCEFMFKGSGDIIGYNNDKLSDSIKGNPKRPSQRHNKTINVSVMLLSPEAYKHNLTNSILDSMTKNRISKKHKDVAKMISHDINVSLMRIGIQLDVNRLPSNKILKKSQYGDYKTKLFNSLVNGASFIELDVGIFEERSTVNRYKNIDNLWLSYNENKSWYDETKTINDKIINYYYNNVEDRKIRMDSRRNAGNSPLIKIIGGSNQHRITRMSSYELKKYFRNKSIILVANSSKLLEYSHGDFIDSHDIVIRFNAYHIDKKHTGEKTNIHCVFRNCKEILNDTIDYKIIISKPTKKWIEAIGKELKVDRGYSIIDYNFPKYRIKEKFGLKIKSPTSGMCMFLMLAEMNLLKQVSLIGFNAYLGGDINQTLRKTKNSKLASNHNYDLEYKYLSDRFYNTNEITLKYKNI